MDEPSMCRFSVLNDTEYEQMENMMQCDTSVHDSGTGRYRCSFDPQNLNMSRFNGDIYLRCRDNPPRTRTYRFSLYQDANASSAAGVVEDENGTYFDAAGFEASLLSPAHNIGLSTNSTPVHLALPEHHECTINGKRDDL